MKIFKTYLITIAALLCCVTVNAADFEVDGIYYNITSSAYMEVEVIGSSSSGEIEIPRDKSSKTRKMQEKNTNV